MDQVTAHRQPRLLDRKLYSARQKTGANDCGLPPAGQNTILCKLPQPCVLTLTKDIVSLVASEFIVEMGKLLAFVVVELDHHGDRVARKSAKVQASKGSRPDALGLGGRALPSKPKDVGGPVAAPLGGAARRRG